MAKPKTVEEATQMVETLKAEISTDSEALKEFMKANKIKKGETPSDEKIAKKYGKMVASLDKKRADRDAAKEAIKALTPKKSRESKYEYPADVVTAEDKKKYRTKMRNAAKSEGKAKSKKEKKAEAPVEKSEKVSKKDKKAKKAKETATPEMD